MRSAWFASSRDRWGDAALELALVVALADDHLDDDAWDRLARALDDEPAFASIAWDGLRERAETLREEAPLFTEARDRLVRQLATPDAALPALRFAARLLGEEGSGEGAALLHDVAVRLGRPPPEPAPRLPLPVRAAFDDPDAQTELAFSSALARAGSTERRLLLGKLQAARGCLYRLGPGARVLELGRHVPVGHALFRIDAVIERSGTTWLARILADQEALHASERRLLPSLVDALDAHQHLVLAHVGRLARPDRAAFDDLAHPRASRLDLAS